MALVVLGINHKSAPLFIREKWSLDDEGCKLALAAIIRAKVAEEVILVSTCNRTELYAVSNSITSLKKWLAEHHNITEEWLAKYGYVYFGKETAQHLIAVACGLNSMVLGENQIIGQLKKAVLLANQTKSIKKLLSRLFQVTFQTAKKVRTQTDIGNNPLSVAYLAAQLPRRIFEELNSCVVGLIGAGKTIQLVAKYLKNNGVNKYCILNRNLAAAKEIADSYQGTAATLEQIPQLLATADIIIIATASQKQLVTYNQVVKARPMKRNQPQIIIDLSVPRNINPAVKSIDDVYLYSVDDLNSLIADNQKLRANSISTAKEIIQEACNEFLQWQKNLNNVPLLKEFREECNNLREKALLEANKQLDSGNCPRTVVQHLAYRLTKQLIHLPTVKFRESGIINKNTVHEITEELLEQNEK